MRASYDPKSFKGSTSYDLQEPINDESCQFSALFDGKRAFFAICLDKEAREVLLTHE